MNCKMRVGIAHILFFLYPFAGAAQNRTLPSDSARIFNLIDKAEWHFGNNRYDSALYYSRHAGTLSRQINYPRGLAYALIEQTDILIDKDDLAAADELPAQTNSVGLQLKDSLITAISFMQMAQIKMWGDKAEAALPLFEKAVNYYFGKHASKYAALNYNDYGYCWGLTGDLQKKADCLLKSISVYESLGPGNEGEQAAALNNLSTVYYELNDISRAIEYAKKSLLFREKSGDIARLSLGCCNLSQLYRNVNNAEAENYRQRCVKYALQSGDESNIIQAYIASSLIASDRNDFEASVEFELKAIQLLEKSSRNSAQLARRYIAVGMGAARLHRDSAVIIGYYNRALEISNRVNDKYNLRDVYFQLNDFFQKRQNYPEAYQYYSRYIAVRDSIIKENTTASIAGLEKKYQTEKLDNEIARLTAAQRIKELQLEKNRALIAGNLLEAQKKQNEISLLSQSRELQAVEIKQRDAELEKQQLLARANQQQLQLAAQDKLLNERKMKNQQLVRNFLLAGLVLLVVSGFILFNRFQLKKKLEQQAATLHMRNNISQNLHDDIGASLSSINILTELAKRNTSNPEKAADYLNKAGENIQQISESLGDIVWNINPRYDDLQNLFVRMKRYASDMFDGKNIKYAMTFPEAAAVSLSMDKRRDFYLIFKEAVNNLTKYSQATAAEVTVSIENNQLVMQVKDNGRGFQLSAVTQLGNGIHNMQQRAGKWQAPLSVETAPGRGTAIRLSMQAG